ncbi:FUSC family protein [Enterocloster lavalensis]|uniref:FUSC family protein n=1 Tax=Enterocloster lavalensis TaxID=460384 RepID=UPI00140A030C|nr:FUSC family protein [Enterocloster lavalensis]
MASQTLRSLAGRAKLAFTDAAPVILFFLIAFYSILWLFGVKYIIVVSVLATLFKVRCRKRQTMAKLLSMAAVQLSLAVLAFLAGHWLILCVILNILVPFLLVFLQSTQFNQKGYFTSAMGFVFFQLNPVAVSEFGRFLCAMTYGLLLLAGALLIYSRGRERDVDYGLERRGLEVLAGHLSAWAAGEENAEAGELLSIQRALCKQVEQSRGISYAVKREGQIHYMAALLFQRSAYFLTVLRENGTGEEEKRFLLRLCAFLREFNGCWPGTGTKAGADGEENGSRALRENGEELARDAGMREDGIGRFGEQTVSLLLTLLSRLEQRDLPLAAVRRRSGEKGRPLAWILQRFRPDTFEMRFSLRLSSVLTLGFLFSRLSGCNHAYWFVLNAFLLLQPMYEDSAFRLKNRFIGTVAGCTLLYFALPLFPGVQGHFALASVIVAFMYCTLPGTWQQAVFSTAFSITLASLAMQETMAMELRLVYVGLATVFVLAVNRFFFPTSMRGQFQDNIRALFHMQHSYLRIFVASLHVPLDYGAVRDGLVRFQLIYEQVEEYLQAHLPAPEQADYRRLLELFWKMSSEMEQILFLTAARKREIGDTAALEHFSSLCSYVIQEAGNMVCVRMRQEPVTARAVPVSAQVEGAPYLSALLKKYSQDVSALYRLALNHKK